ncbi:hypothetical protein ACOTJR_27980 [Achromobacter xylosoxidans]
MMAARKREHGTAGSAATMNAIEDARRAAAGLQSAAETARMNGEVEHTSKMLQDAYACESTRAFPHRYLAIGYAARVAAAMLLVARVERVTVHILPRADEDNFWAVTVGNDAQYEDVACMASAVLAAGSEAACGWCERPADAVQQVRDALRGHSAAIYALERTIDADIHTPRTITRRGIRRGRPS